MNCICELLGEGGDASPRMWRCEIHGISVMAGFTFIVKEMMEKYNCSEECAKEAAYYYYRHLTSKASLERKIYYSEDFFQEDLRKEFKI